MRTIEALYLIFSVTLTTIGLTMVTFSFRAYTTTGRDSMMYLGTGFGLVVAAAIGTTVFAFFTGFRETRTLLTLNYLITTAGYLFVMYSIVVPD